jgi:transposase
MSQATYEQLLHVVAQKDRQIAQQQSRIEQLEGQVAQLRVQVRELTARLEEALRANKRQAGPFAKGPPKDHPKPPGRKAGPDYGLKAYRPIPDGIPDEIIDVPLPDRCPHCAGPTAEERTACQFQTEIPRRAILRRFDIHIGHCRRCGRRIQPRHPLQTSDALGAAASQLGADAQAAIVHLNKHGGLSHGKVAEFFGDFFGIPLSRGGACRTMLRAADRCQRVYQAIVRSVRHFPWIVPDETGWRIGGWPSWLHVFVTARTTCYVIDRSRGYDVAASVIGGRYAGALIHDGFATYDRFVFAAHQQCLDHLLRRCRNLLLTAPAGAVRFPRQVQSLLGDALGLRDRRDEGELSPHGLSVAVGRLQARLDRMLSWTRMNPDNERLAAHLARHRNELFTFLTVPGIDATNYRAEQAIRPAAANRKVCAGNRTVRGALAQSVLLSVLRTCRQQARDSVAFLAGRLRGRPLRLTYLPAGP